MKLDLTLTHLAIAPRPAGVAGSAGSADGRGDGPGAPSPPLHGLASDLSAAIIVGERYPAPYGAVLVQLSQLDGRGQVSNFPFAAVFVFE